MDSSTRVDRPVPATGRHREESGPIAFTNAGDIVFLAQGGTLRYFYSFGGADRGFQQAGADIKTPNNGAEVVAFDQSKQKLTNGTTTYRVSFRNLGPGGIFFNIQGGGAA
ncbi:hypothetical protein SAMN05660690_2932 [Geodermatophilus telluris]|uniref:Uncharacterized protein n=1 Tax=Geodermatophilus telluris TaxID=1190417 RepID=A0A1G6QIC3_9ACTN|nr:hypothetical protein SAMN05660690_2932 [Geodermatophilus telluris]